MNILVPTDFSEIADNALAYAAMLAARLDAKIILLHVIPPNSIWWTSFDSLLIAEAKQKQEEIRRKLIGDGTDPSDIETHVISDFPLNKYINNFISDHEIGFVIMGTKGGGISKAFLGSFTMGMINNVHIPVIAVPPQAKTGAIRHILYPTDLEDVPGETKKILDLAKTFNATIHIVHIPDNFIGSEILAHHSLLEINRLTGYPHITTEVVNGNRISDVINQQLLTKNADLLVMFAHKKGFFEKLFKGSRPEQMSHHTEVPLLVFRKPEKHA